MKQTEQKAPHRSKVTTDTSSPTKTFFPTQLDFSFTFLQAERSGMGGKGQVIPTLAQNIHELIVLTPGRRSAGRQTAITRLIISHKFSLEE